MRVYTGWAAINLPVKYAQFAGFLHRNEELYEQYFKILYLIVEQFGLEFVMSFDSYFIELFKLQSGQFEFRSNILSKDRFISKPFDDVISLIDIISLADDLSLLEYIAKQKQKIMVSK